MGIYDREYYRQDDRPAAWGGPRSAIAIFILINVAVFLANGLLTSDSDRIAKALQLTAGDLARPWNWWRLISYGFVHDPHGFGHILFNMLGLWFLGRDVEGLYGRGEFARIYLALVIAGGLFWAVLARLRGAGDEAAVVGASGAVVGVIVLFALNFPRRSVILFPIPIAMPAWVLGVLIVLGDLLQAISRPEAHVAYTVHLTGAAMAFAYFRFGWNFGSLAGRWTLRGLGSRPRLRVHDPEAEDDELNEVVDRILEKIHRQGEASLTRRERRILENASRLYQRRRQRSGRD